MAYSLGPVKPHVSAAADLIGGRFGIKTIYGWRPVDPYPDHPSGRALDFMINNIASGKSVGDALSQYVMQNADALNVDYIIWYRKVWTRAKGWHTYTGSNPHTDHVHVSFWATAKVAISSNAANLVAVSNPYSDTKEAYNRLNEVAAWVNEADNWKRIGFVAAGLFFLFFGIFKFGSVAAPVTNAIKGAVKQ